VLTLAYSAHTILPDGGTLLAVVDTRTERRWFRTIETSDTVTYVHRAGTWWRGAKLDRVTDNRTILALCEFVIRAGIRESVDKAVG